MGYFFKKRPARFLLLGAFLLLANHLNGTRDGGTLGRFTESYRKMLRVNTTFYVKMLRVINTFIIFADDWDMPDGAKLPLWMLGFLY